MADLGPLPRWDLSNVYPGLDSKPFEAALAELDERIAAHERAIDADGIGGAGSRVPADDEALARMIEGYIARASWISTRYGTLGAFIHSFFSTDTSNEVATRRISELELRGVKVEAVDIRFTSWARDLAPRLDALCRRSDAIAAHRFFLEETIEQARHMMSEAEEQLASALAPTAESAWARLQQTISSQIQVEVEKDGKLQKFPMSRVRTFAAEPDGALRERAYRAEVAAWKAWQEPIAAALNGVKGWASTLLPKRGYAKAIEQSIEQSRIDAPTLDALIGAMKDSLPDFRRYLGAKAKALGKTRLAWWDIQAPVGKADKVWQYADAETFVVSRFASFSQRLSDYAKRAFDGRWIDAEPRAGKVGGAFCMGVPEVKESRVLMNFDGTFDQVSTLAHELGHGFHNECLKDRTPLQRRTPMTLAETASIFCETIIFNAAMSEAPAKDQLGILETNLLGSCQVVVDIYSRYLFETRVFERRSKSDLSAGEFCALMREAQIEAYGDAVEADTLHPYMWAVKGHYYSANMGFYNYPYAFGLLFGLGLFAIFKARGAAFCADYEALLGATGMGKAADLAAGFGIDIRAKKFWADGLAEVRGLIDRYVKLVG